jgi:hypothetical protein
MHNVVAHRHRAAVLHSHRQHISPAASCVDVNTQVASANWWARGCAAVNLIDQLVC